MNKFFISIAAVALILSFQLTGCSKAVKSDKRAAAIVAEMHDPTSKNVLVACHRGDWRNYPENSLPAIESVIRMGADIVELDIALTSDSVLVLMHDRTIDRCTTGKGRVQDMSYDSLQTFYMKTAHGVRSSLDLKVPTLREALEVCKDRIVVNIDKGYDYYDLVLAITEELGVTDQILIKGSKSLADVTEKMAAHPHNMMYMPVVSPASEKSAKLFDEYIAANEPQLAYEVCWSKMTPEIESSMSRILKSGSKLWVNSLWNSLCGGLSDDIAYETSAEEVYGKLIDMGTTMIQTDRPELLLNYLRSRGLHD